MSADLPVWIMLGICLLLLIAIVVWLGYMTQNKDNAAAIQNNLTIIAGITGILVGLFGATAYVYFSSNVAYLTPFLLVMTFVNLFLSLFAVSASSLQVVKS